MTTTIEPIHEVVTFSGAQYSLDERGRMLRTGRDGVVTVLEEGDDGPTAADKQQLRDDQLAGKRVGIAESYLDWIAAMLSSQLPRAKAMAKAKELMMEFYAELAAFDADPDKAMDKQPGQVAAEAKALRMLTAAGVTHVSEATTATLAAVIREGNGAKAKAIVDDWSKLARNANRSEAARGARTHDDVLRFVRS